MARIKGDWLTNPNTQRVMAMLTDAGHQSYFVGGCVRNALINMPVADVDIATDARPDQVLALAKNSRLVAIPTGIDHGTITVMSGNIPHEITTYRRDVQTDGRHAVVAFADNIVDDARRRDFTMNALYADAFGAVLDPLGGMADLVRRRVRFIDDAGARIREDYLRTLRFFRFNAWYGRPADGLDQDALDAIAQNLDGLGGLSRERVGAEMLKLLSAPDPAPAACAMEQVGALSRILPGATAQYLAPLVHLETGDLVDPIRRLAVLGGDGPAGRFRLSKAQEKQLAQLLNGVSGTDAVAVNGYRHGARMAVDIELVRGAMLGTPPPQTMRAAAARGDAQTFPIKAADLMPAFQGPALGQRLKQLEENWIRSDFQLTRTQLLG